MLNVKVIVSVFNQEKALVGSFSVNVKSLQTFVCSSISQPGYIYIFIFKKIKSDRAL